MSWGAVIAGTAAIAGSAIKAGGSKSAAKIQEGASVYATDIQNRQFQQTRQDLAPWMDVGAASLTEQRRQLGLPAYDPGTSQYAGGSDFAQTGAAGLVDIERAFQDFLGRPATAQEREYYSDRERADQLYRDVVMPGLEKRRQEAPAGAAQEGGKYGAFEASPGYQWLQDETMRAVDAGAASGGRFFAGSRDKARARYAAGVASQDYGSYFARLQSLSGSGQTAATSVGQFGQQTAASTAGNVLYGGAARASGVAGSSEAIAEGITTLGNVAGDWWENRQSKPQPLPPLSN